MPDKLSERDSNLVGLAAAAHFLATGVPRMDAAGNISQQRIQEIAIPAAPGFVRYVQKTLPMLKDMVSLESLDYAAAVRGWTAFIDGIRGRMERDKDNSILLTGEIFLLLAAIAAQKLGIVNESLEVLKHQIFDEIIESLPSEAANDAEVEEAVA